MRTKRDAIKQWTISTDDNIIITKWGALNGKIQESRKDVKGKNIGKINETSPSEQAILEAKSIIKRKIDEGYSLDIPRENKTDNIDNITKVLPMLACDYNQRYKSIIFPCYVQPKLDGIRMMCHLDENGKVICKSRTNKMFNNLAHIESQIKEIFIAMNFNEVKTIYIDGEIFNPRMDFQNIVSATKRLQNETTNLEYHIYDIYFIKDNYPFSKRLLKINEINEIICVCNNLKLQNIKVVKTYTCQSFDCIKKYHDDFVNCGYEGVIIRNFKGVYNPGYRSSDLQKYKEFEDAEYKIVDAKEGVGKFKGMCIWECETNNGRRFSVKSNGSAIVLKDYWKNRENYIGKYITIKYQGKTTNNVPRFPIGKVIRDYE